MTGGVEPVGGFGVGVLVEQPVEHGEGVGVRLPGLPGVGRGRDGQGVGLSAAEADVGVDVVGLGERDVVDEQPDDPFTFPLRGGAVGPQRGEVGGERADPGFVLLAERRRGGAGALVVVVGALDGPQRVVPVGFEGVGDEPVVGVDGEVASAGEVGALVGALDVAVPRCRRRRRGFPVRLGRSVRLRGRAG